MVEKKCNTADFPGKYRDLLRELDAWFHATRTKYASRMQCGEGCVRCCQGLFDVSLPDAFVVAEGFRRLSGPVRREVRNRASAIHAGILHEAPELKEPYFLSRISEETIDSISDSFREDRCPLLSIDDRCLIYESRPSPCLLEGIPMVDLHDGLFDDWCALNFKGGISPEIEKDVSLDYYELEAVIQRASKALAERMPRKPEDGATVFIPSIIIAFDNYWSHLILE